LHETESLTIVPPWAHLRHWPAGTRNGRWQRRRSRSRAPGGRTKRRQKPITFAYMTVWMPLPRI